jgi:S1-C subfamily serine protease
MEELNKNQIVLLTLLISFVTSIATGIMTNSLLQQAPLEVTRNINRIVEKTIETVTPAPTDNGSKEVTTVVVKEEDQIIDSINKNVKSIARITAKNTDNGLSDFYSIGLVMNKDGLITAERWPISSANKYTAKMSDGTEFVLTPLGVDKQTNFIVFKPNVPEKSSYVFVPATFSEAEPKLGQTVVGLGGEESNTVAIGRVVSLDNKNDTVGTTTTKYLSGINTDVSTRDLTDGSPFFNLSGDIIGIKVSSDASRSVVPSSILKKEVLSLVESTKSL